MGLCSVAVKSSTYHNTCFRFNIILLSAPPSAKWSFPRSKFFTYFSCASLFPVHLMWSPCCLCDCLSSPYVIFSITYVSQSTIHHQKFMQLIISWRHLCSVLQHAFSFRFFVAEAPGSIPGQSVCVFGTQSSTGQSCSPCFSFPLWTLLHRCSLLSIWHHLCIIVAIGCVAKRRHCCPSLPSRLIRTIVSVYHLYTGCLQVYTWNKPWL